jgi:hypothetical protein
LKRCRRFARHTKKTKYRSGIESQNHGQYRRNIESSS